MSMWPLSHWATPARLVCIALVLTFACFVSIHDEVAALYGLTFGTKTNSNGTRHNNSIGAAGAKLDVASNIRNTISDSMKASKDGGQPEIMVVLPELFLRRVLGHFDDNDTALPSTVVLDDSTAYLFPDGSPDPYPRQLLEKAWTFHNKTTGNVKVVEDSLTSLIQRVCSVTSQIKLYAQNDTWLLQSLDESGTPKTIGGDEYYITYTEESGLRSVAFIEDCANGLYRLQFTEAPLNARPSNGSGTVDIYLEWSCGLGLVQPPLKDTWFTGGMINAHWNRSNMAAPSHVKTWQNPNHDKLLHRYLHVVNIGDSTMVQFVSRNWCTKNYKRNIRCNKGLKSPYYMHMRNGTMEMVRSSDAFLTEDNVALLLGSNAWDITADVLGLMGAEMREFTETATTLIREIREIYPNVTVIWKSGTSLHPHRLLEYPGEDWYYVMRTAYMSNSRARMHYELEKNLMAALEIPFLDLFDFTYLQANYHKTPSDALHVSPQMNRIMLSWFYYQ